MRGSGANRRLRCLTHPIAFPIPLPVTKEEKSIEAESSQENIYTNMALGNSIQNLMLKERTADTIASNNVNPNQINTTNDLSQQLAATTATSCHNKSIQNLIREERVGIPVPGTQLHQRLTGYKGSTEDLRTSGRSSPIKQSLSTPNSPPKHLIATNFGCASAGSFHDRVRAPSPSPLMQAAATTTTGAENRLIEHTHAYKFYILIMFLVKVLFFFYLFCCNHVFRLLRPPARSFS